MKQRILLLLALFILLLDMSSCTMHVVSGTPYHVWSPGRRTRHHYGARRNYHQRREIWGRHHYGPRTYGHRGRYR